MGAFGDKFRKERERRGFTLDQVSNVTKINARMLKAIEDEHFDLLPGGVFNKGFVRAYAKHLGLNDEESVTEYLAALRQAQVDAETAAWQSENPIGGRAAAPPPPKSNGEKVRVQPKSVAPTVTVTPSKAVAEEAQAAIKHEPVPAQTGKSTPGQISPAQKYSAADLSLGATSPPSDSIPWKVPAVVLAVIIVAAMMWNRHSRGVHADEANGPHQPAPPAAAVSNSQAGAPSPGTAVATTATTASPTSNLPPSSSAQRSAHGEVSQAAPAAAGHEPRAGSTDLATGNAAADRAIPDHGSTPKKLAAAVPARNAPPVFTLRIRASETSWIAVTADGQPVIHETLIAPAGTSFRASREITVRVGNAAGVSFEINGKDIQPQGGEAEVKTITFDAKGIKEDSHAAAPEANH